MAALESCACPASCEAHPNLSLVLLFFLLAASFFLLLYCLLLPTPSSCSPDLVLTAVLASRNAAVLGPRSPFLMTRQLSISLRRATRPNAQALIQHMLPSNATHAAARPLLTWWMRGGCGLRPPRTSCFMHLVLNLTPFFTRDLPERLLNSFVAPSILNMRATPPPSFLCPLSHSSSLSSQAHTGRGPSRGGTTPTYLQTSSPPPHTATPTRRRKPCLPPPAAGPYPRKLSGPYTTRCTGIKRKRLICRVVV